MPDGENGFHFINKETREKPANRQTGKRLFLFVNRMQFLRRIPQ